MFKKLNRLNQKKDFDLIFKKGFSSYGENIGIKLIKNDLKINRFGVIVGLKISKKAVERNKIKKQIKSFLEKEDLLLKKGYDFVFIALPPIKNKSYKEICLEIVNNLKKLSVY